MSAAQPDVDTAATLRTASTTHDIALARELFVEYARKLGVDLCFQGFEQELASLPGAYAPPRGRLILAGEPGRAFGCVALRPLAKSGAASSQIGEVKRLFVRDAHRSGGWGRKLAHAVIDEARAIGYRELVLDTLDSMHAARALYTSLRFVACDAYYHNPIPGAIYMRLPLA